MKMKKLWFIVIVNLVLGLGTAWCFKGLFLVDKINKLLDNKNYIVVFQNNNELRATGGFMGSYAAVSVQGLGFRDVRIQDIYVPDGQLVGHVDPPAPIQQAFGQGWWKLRDSNWDPDFNIAGEQIAWFFEQGGEKADGIIAINLSLVNKVLEILGEIKLTDYPEKITNKTFYNLAQKYAEVGAFPGSTQKRDFLGAVGRGMMEKIKTIGPIGQIRLIGQIYGEFKKGEILVWFRDKALASSVQGLDKSDYLYIVESNLGANKANCCIERQVVQEINNTETKLVIKYQNNNPFESPKPPYFWGGNYIDYLRVVLPKQTEIKQVKVDEKVLSLQKLDNQFGRQEDRYEIQNKDDYITVGFWAVVPAQKSIDVIVEYKSIRAGERGYKILVKHQPGIESFKYSLTRNGKVVGAWNISQDTVISLGRGSN